MSKASQYVSKAEIFYLYFRRDANAEVRRLYQEAIKLDPALSRPYADLAYSELLAWLYNWDPSVTDLRNALIHVEQAVKNGAEDYYSNWILADVQLYRQDFAAAAKGYDLVQSMAKTQCIPEEQRAVDVDWADMLLLTGNAGQAIEVINKAINESPVAEKWFFWVLGWAYYVNGQYDESLDVLGKLGNPRNAIRKNIIANLVALNRPTDATYHAHKFLAEENEQGITYAASGKPVWAAMEVKENKLPFQDKKQLQIWKNHLEVAFSKQVAP